MRTNVNRSDVVHALACEVLNPTQLVVRCVTRDKGIGLSARGEVSGSGRQIHVHFALENAGDIEVSSGIVGHCSHFVVAAAAQFIRPREGVKTLSSVDSGIVGSDHGHARVALWPGKGRCSNGGIDLSSAVKDAHGIDGIAHNGQGVEFGKGTARPSPRLAKNAAVQVVRQRHGIAARPADRISGGGRIDVDRVDQITGQPKLALMVYGQTLHIVIAGVAESMSPTVGAGRVVHSDKNILVVSLVGVGGAAGVQVDVIVKDAGQSQGCVSDEQQVGDQVGTVTAYFLAPEQCAVAGAVGGQHPVVAAAGHQTLGVVGVQL